MIAYVPKVPQAGDCRHRTVKSPNATDSLEPLIVGPHVAWRLHGCSNPYGYELLVAGELGSYLDGRARKITMALIRRRIERQLPQPKNLPVRTTGCVVAPPSQPAAQAWRQDHTMIGEQSHAHDRAAVGATAIIQTIVTALRSRLDDHDASLATVRPEIKAILRIEFPEIARNAHHEIALADDED